MHSSSPDTFRASSTSGASGGTAIGAVATGARSRSSSSSSQSRGLVRRSTPKRKSRTDSTMAHLNRPPGAPARRADAHGLRPHSTVVEETGIESFQSTPAESSDAPPLTLAQSLHLERHEVDAPRSEQHTTFQDQRQFNLYQQVDARVLNVSPLVEDPRILQAIQAVLEARGETAQIHAQSQILAARFAGELQSANLRETAMRREIERLQQTEEQLRSAGNLLQLQLDEAKHELQATQDRLRLVVSAQSPNATGSHLPDDMRQRVGQCEATLQNGCQQLEVMNDRWSGELQSMRELVEQLWWEPQQSMKKLQRSQPQLLPSRPQQQHRSFE